MEDICYICREPNNELSITLPCSHKYHTNCIKNSIKFSTTECPYCRTYITIKMINDLQQIITCKGIYKTGKKKGQSCCNKALINNDGYCGKHKKICKQ